MKKGFAFLCTGIVSFGVGFYLGGKMLVKMINDYKLRMTRNLSNMMVLNNWLEFVYSGGNIEQYFHSRNYSRIMIYGNGYIGKRLLQALAKTDVEVVAVMDKKALLDGDSIVLGLESDIPNVDCIVVTPVFYYNEISNELRNKTNIPIIPIEEIWTAYGVS